MYRVLSLLLMVCAAASCKKIAQVPHDTGATAQRKPQVAVEPVRSHRDGSATGGTWRVPLSAECEKVLQQIDAAIAERGHCKTAGDCRHYDSCVFINRTADTSLLNQLVIKRKELGCAHLVEECWRPKADCRGDKCVGESEPLPP